MSSHYDEGIPSELSLSRASALAGLSPAAFRTLYLKTGRLQLCQPEIGSRPCIHTADLEAALGRSFGPKDLRRLDDWLVRERKKRRKRSLQATGSGFKTRTLEELLAADLTSERKG